MASMNPRGFRGCRTTARGIPNCRAARRTRSPRCSRRMAAGRPWCKTSPLEHAMGNSCATSGRCSRAVASRVTTPRLPPAISCSIKPRTSPARMDGPRCPAITRASPRIKMRSGVTRRSSATALGGRPMRAATSAPSRAAVRCLRGKFSAAAWMAGPTPITPPKARRETPRHFRSAPTATRPIWITPARSCRRPGARSRR